MRKVVQKSAMPFRWFFLPPVGNPEGPAALEAKAAQLAAEAMRLRWQAQRLRGE